jgi:phospholipid/cholesterol/gamma-HCH transport system ATP-binding protein
MEPFIELQHIIKLKGTRPIIKRVSSIFNGGETTAIMGFSGCGKSLFLKIAAGIVPPDRGTVRFHGENIYDMDPGNIRLFRKVNGFAFQDAALWANKSVFQNLALPLQFHFPELSAAEMNGRIGKILDQSGYRDSPNLRPDQLSMGERKIVSFARAMVTDPDILFLDDPFSSIDHHTIDRILNLLKRKKEEGVSIIAVSHSAELVSKLADRIIIMHDGRIIEQGQVNTILNTTNPLSSEILAKVFTKPEAFDSAILDILGDDDFRL